MQTVSKGGFMHGLFFFVRYYSYGLVTLVMSSCNIRGTDIGDINFQVLNFYSTAVLCCDPPIN